MNKGIIISLAVFAVVLFYSCGPLEGGEVIGPGGGYVFYDKGNYSDGWRYLESPPKDAGKLSGASGTNIDFAKARELADAFSYGGFKDWRLPTDDEFKHMGKYFLDRSWWVNDKPDDSGGLQFSDKIYYVTSDSHAFYCRTGNDISESEFIQGSGKYEDGCEYIVHLIRGF